MTPRTKQDAKVEWKGKVISHGGAALDRNLETQGPVWRKNPQDKVVKDPRGNRGGGSGELTPSWVRVTRPIAALSALSPNGKGEAGVLGKCFLHF